MPHLLRTTGQRGNAHSVITVRYHVLPPAVAFLPLARHHHGDRRPGLSQAGESSSSAHQALPNRGHGALRLGHQIMRSRSLGSADGYRSGYRRDENGPGEAISEAVLPGSGGGI